MGHFSSLGKTICASFGGSVLGSRGDPSVLEIVCGWEWIGCVL